MSTISQDAETLFKRVKYVVGEADRLKKTYQFPDNLLMSYDFLAAIVMAGEMPRRSSRAHLDAVRKELLNLCTWTEGDTRIRKVSSEVVKQAKELAPLIDPFLEVLRSTPIPNGTAYQNALQTLEFIAARGEIADPTAESLKQVKDSVTILAKLYLNHMGKPPHDPIIAHLFPKKPEPTWGLTGIPQTPENTVQVVNPNIFDQLAKRAVLKKSVDFLAEKAIDVTNEFLSLSHNHPLPPNSPEGEAYFRLKPIAFREDIPYPNMEVLNNVREDIETLRKWHANKLGVPVDTYEPLSVRPKKVHFQHLEQEANAVTSLVMKTVLEGFQHQREHPLPKTYEAAFDALVEIHLRGSLFGSSSSRLAKVREHIQTIVTWMRSTSKKEEPVKETTVKVGMQHFYKVSAASGEEGNGPTRILGNFRSQPDATLYSRGKAAGGSNARVEAVSAECIELNGKLFLLGAPLVFLDEEETKRKAIVESIKAKLSPEEFAATGLKV